MNAIPVLASVCVRGIFTSWSVGPSRALHAGLVGDASFYGRGKLKEYIDDGIWLPESFSKIFPDVILRGRVHS